MSLINEVPHHIGMKAHEMYPFIRELDIFVDDSDWNGLNARLFMRASNFYRMHPDLINVYLRFTSNCKEHLSCWQWALICAKDEYIKRGIDCNRYLYGLIEPDEFYGLYERTLVVKDGN